MLPHIHTLSFTPCALPTQFGGSPPDKPKDKKHAKGKQPAKEKPAKRRLGPTQAAVSQRRSHRRQGDVVQNDGREEQQIEEDGVGKDDSLWDYS